MTLHSEHCPAVLPAQRDTVFFHDSANLRHSKRASVARVTAIPRRQVDATTVVADYVIASTDTVGIGVFVVLCGGHSNAGAPFTVTS